MPTTGGANLAQAVAGPHRSGEHDRPGFPQCSVDFYDDGAVSNVRAVPAAPPTVVYPDTSPIISYTYGDPVAGPGRLASCRGYQQHHRGHGHSANAVSGYATSARARIVTEDYQLPQVKLDYSANNLAGLGPLWPRAEPSLGQLRPGNSGTVDGYPYTYDPAGNRTSHRT